RDAEGKPAPHAIVNLSSAAGGESGQMQPLADGSFAFHGLPPGRYQLEAQDYLAASDLVSVEVSETPATDAVTLTLSPITVLLGDVFSPAGPVAGARVDAVATDREQMSIIPATTDLTGEFESLLAPGTKHVAVTVAPPGFAYKMFSIDVQPKKLRVPVSQEGGTLVMGDPPPQHDWWIARNGAEASVGLLLSTWGGGRTMVDGKPRIEVPMMEPGAYTLCAVRPDEGVAFVRGVLPQGRCVSGYLAPFGTLALELPRDVASR
ncbi:MAG TPA: carboxypeptidase regulatory-like domain-containing protein, partial [Thermoanaerobaculia bacterium]